MKKKFLSILFALVLVVSFSLVTAVPAGAAPVTQTVTGDGAGGFTLAEMDQQFSTATVDASAGDTILSGSVTLGNFLAGNGNDVWYEAGLVSDETYLGYSWLHNKGVYMIALRTTGYYKVHVQNVAGQTPDNVGVDNYLGNGDGYVDLWSDAGLSYFKVPNATFDYELKYHDVTVSDGQVDLRISVDAGTTWSGWKLYQYAEDDMENFYGWTHEAAVASGYATDDDLTDARVVSQIFVCSTTTATFTADYDDIEVNDVPYTLAPRVLNVDTGKGYAGIQPAIDDATGTTITVAAGTYNEDVTVDKDLTLEGAQVGVDPRGGRAGDESEIVGVVVVTSDAANVTIDGFTLTSPTRSLNPRGFNLGVESESSTIRNNILVAEENAGHVPYGSYLTFQDITNALVEQNSFSGHLDLIQGPNVILFYGIAAGGVVTVQNNEMHDVGGGGGIGVMCGNADVVVNIDGNEIENTGNECIWVWNPGTSAFATLSITSNDLSEATLNGIKFVAPITGTVSVSGNEFWDNPVQILDSAEILDIQDVLDNNTFDRAVVVRGSAIKVPTIFSLIQDAVNAAVTGDTVDVAKGTYDEVVLVNESVNLLGANAGVCAGVDPGARGPETVVDGTIRIAASDVVIDGIKLINGGTVLGAGVGIYMIDQSHITITNSILVGPVSPSRNAMILGSYGGTAETHSEDINVTCCESYNWNMGAYVNPGGGFSNDYLFQYNNFHDNTHCGLGLDVSGVSVLNNNFTDNEIGIESFRENVVVHFNNFCGNTVAIDNSGGPIDATNNWWCHASGPSHSPGYGDPVSGDVLYDPWLLEPLVPGAPLPTQFDKTLVLNIGWTLVSTDNWIDATETVGEGVILALNYTPSLGWFEVDPTALVPVNAIYLKMEEGGGLGITYSGGVPAASSKDLEAGWNLISSATLTNARAVLSPLRYIQVGDEQGVGLATLVSQGDYNQHSPSFYLATLGPGDWNFLGGIMLNPFDGYWVYMNDGKSFGVVPD